MEIMEFQLSYYITNPKDDDVKVLNMPTALKNSLAATGLEKVSFDTVPKKGNAKECSYNCIQKVSLVKILYYFTTSIGSRKLTPH